MQIVALTLSLSWYRNTRGLPYPLPVLCVTASCMPHAGTPAGLWGAARSNISACKLCAGCRSTLFPETAICNHSCEGETCCCPGFEENAHLHMLSLCTGSTFIGVCITMSPLSICYLLLLKVIAMHCTYYSSLGQQGGSSSP